MIESTLVSLNQINQWPELMDAIGSLASKDFAKEKGGNLEGINKKLTNGIYGLKTQNILSDPAWEVINIEVLPVRNVIPTMLVDANGDQIVTFGWSSTNIIQVSASTTTATITTWWVAQQIQAATAWRRYFEFQNNSSLDMRVSFGGTASATNGFIIKPDQSYNTSSILSTQSISLFATTTGQQFTYLLF